MIRSDHANGKPLSPQQEKVLAFVASRPTFPTIAEVAEHMGWKNTHSAADCLNRIAWKGLIVRLGMNRWALKSA